jgi:signal transduction histidine kinase
MRIQQALALGILGIFLLMAVGQLGTLWWFQQQLQQQLTTQSGELSKLVLARTAEKLQLVTHNVSSDGHNFVFTTDQEAEGIKVITKTERSPQQTTETSAANKKSQPESTQQKVQVFHLNGEPNDALPGVMQQELDQIMIELKTDEPTTTQWVQRFKVERKDSSQQLLAQYLSYQVLALAVSIALALGLTLWLGYRFIAPLQLLVGGFKRLANGENQVQLPLTPTLQEYRYVLTQFNQASRQLDELASHRQQLAQQQQLVELGEISRGLVHALRNPIHTMALALEQLPQANPEQQALQQLIEQKMQHINRTLTALLTLSCEGVDRSQPVSLPLVLQDIALEFSNQKVQLQLTLPEQLALAGAEAELRSICHAVISNAVEASPVNGLVTVQLTSAEGKAILQVQDQGPGIAPDIAAQLFQPHISSKAEGAGMGLYLCQRLLQRYYQGQVTLQPADAGGCVATLTIAPATGATS